MQDLIPLDDWFVLQQVDLVKKLYRVTEHRARKYLDPRTGRIVIAPLPTAVKAAGLVGPNLSALAAYQKGDGHMSYSTIQMSRATRIAATSSGRGVSGPRSLRSFTSTRRAAPTCSRRS